MAQDFRDFDKACALHGEIAHRRVPQVVEAKIDKARLVAGVFPGGADVDGLLAV